MKFRVHVPTAQFVLALMAGFFPMFATVPDWSQIPFWNGGYVLTTFLATLCLSGMSGRTWWLAVLGIWIGQSAYLTMKADIMPDEPTLKIVHFLSQTLINTSDKLLSGAMGGSILAFLRERRNAKTRNRIPLPKIPEQF